MNGLPTAALAFPWWPTIGAPLANHLWQSTVFAGLAGLLTLFLRKNHASTRHLVWLIASVKFLLPFSLLVTVGHHVGWSPEMKTPSVLLTVQNISQPFVPANSGQSIASTTLFALAIRSLPSVLLIVWWCGFAAALFYWWSRLRRVSAAIRGVAPVRSGRELEALRRLEQDLGLSNQIDLIFSKCPLEPGVLGIFHPVLVLPAGISDRLSDAQSEAILTHELCQVLRRDNLFAAEHMLVEALFWFYPPVWWLGGRLVDERECACDEEVLRLGSAPQTYAESILKICKFYLESPIFCTAGVTGSNLKKRIEVIMHHQTPVNLSVSRKLLLTSAGFLAVFIPLAFGLLHPSKTHAQSQASNTSSLPVFTSISFYEDKSGKPGVGIFYENDGFSATNYTLLGLVSEAYGVQEAEISGPDWMKSERYDLTAKVDSSAVGELRKLNIDQRRLMLQPLLRDIFHLAVHRETRNAPVYAFVVADNGSRLHDTKSGTPSSMGTLSIRGAGHLSGDHVPLSELVDYFSKQLNRPLLDESGLAGRYDFTLQWTPDSPSGAPGPSLSSALEQQLGLKLDARIAPVEFLVIDNVEKLSENQRETPNG
jgi:bla regulator protein blaR1